MAGNNGVRRGPNKDKPFRDALRMELAEAGEDHKALRAIAKSLMNRAMEGDIQAIKEIGDRLDGKPAQAIIGGEEGDPAVKVETITRTIIESN